MSVVAVIDPARTLAQAVDELLVLTRNQAGGSCVWCGSRELVTGPPSAADATGRANDDCVIVTCRSCGAQLVSERSLRMRGRPA